VVERKTLGRFLPDSEQKHKVRKEEWWLLYGEVTIVCAECRRPTFHEPICSIGATKKQGGVTTSGLALFQKVKETVERRTTTKIDGYFGKKAGPAVPRGVVSQPSRHQSQQMTRSEAMLV